MKIVVVDDDKIIRTGLKKLIERLFDSHEVVGDYQNGLLAYDFLQENEGEVDLVITDIKMPLMTGIELIKKSNEELNKPPIFIVLSGYDEFTYVRDAMKYGAYNYLLKPIKNIELEKLMEEVKKEKNKNQAKDKIIDESVKILKREYFKKMLFSQKKLIENEEENKNTLINSIHLEEGYIYRLIVVDNCSSRIYSEYIKEIIKQENNIESFVYLNKGKIYIVLCLRMKENIDFDEIKTAILEKSKIFTENEVNMYLFKNTKKIYELRDQALLISKIKKDVFEENKGKLFYLSSVHNVNEIFKEESNNSNSTAIRLAKEYIIHNYNKNITLKDVAEEVYLSQNYLSELFKKEVGEGFYDFLSKYRIKKAKEILVATNMKIYEIALKVGYNDSITFGRAFKKITGTTPNTFRNSSCESKCNG